MCMSTTHISGISTDTCAFVEKCMRSILKCILFFYFGSPPFVTCLQDLLQGAPMTTARGVNPEGPDQSLRWETRCEPCGTSMCLLGCMAKKSRTCRVRQLHATGLVWPLVCHLYYNVHVYTKAISVLTHAYCVSVVSYSGKLLALWLWWV